MRYDGDTIIKVFYLPTEARENCIKKNIKTDIKTAPTIKIHQCG